ncbi:MAG: HAMP domain-containing protein, partial [Methanosarcinales archaeon]|nr:HAMP domain-containing protein [Methanosarcinales archaeon]
IPFKFAMFILAFFIVVMATAGYTAYVDAKAVILTDKSRSIGSISISTEHLIDGWYHEHFSKIGQLSTNPFVVNNVNRIVHSDEHDMNDVNGSYDNINRYLTSMASDDHDIIGFTIIDVDGNVLVSTDMSNYTMYSGAKLQEGLSASTVQFLNQDSTTNNFTSDISAPIQIDGKTIAIVVAHLDCEGFMLFTESIMGIGNSGVMHILNPQTYFEYESDGAASYCMKKAINKKEGVEIYKNSNGTDVLGSYRWIDDVGVIMVMEVDADEVLQPIYDLKTKMLINILLLMLFFSALTLMVVGNTIMSIKKLKDSAEKIASGDLGSHVDIIRKDEIGELANAFNSMTHNLGIMTGKLIDSRSKFEAVFEHANIGILVLNAKGHIIMVNSWAQRRWGKYDGKMSCYQYIIGEEGTDADRNSCIGITAIATGETRIKDKVCPKTGSDSIYMEAASPIWDADGNCTGAVILISDVTDSNKARSRLEFTASLFSKTKDFID